MRAQIADMDRIFAVFVPGAEDRLAPEEQRLFDERQEARNHRDFKAADVARAKLASLGVVLEDTPKGTRWRRQRPV